MVSVIIPTYGDPFLQKTIDSLLTSAAGTIEIIPVLDGYTPQPAIRSHPRVKPVPLPKNTGLRGAINAGLAASRGKYIMKCDAHCIFAPRFDTIMSEYCDENWLMIPRRFSLRETTWQPNGHRPVKDYHYLAYPTHSALYGTNISNQDWPEQTARKSNPKYDIDDTMTFQGSCWFAHKNYFMKRVGFLDNRQETYGPWADDVQEIGLKYWLGGGANKVIKKTWYAHLSKRSHHYKSGLFSRQYKINPAAQLGHTWSTRHWLRNEEPNMIHPFSWLVEKFWPVPTWPEDRRLWMLKE